MHYFISFLLLACSVLGFCQGIHFTDAEKQWIKDHPVIEFGYETRWEPYEIYSNGEYSGIIGDYVKLIEEKTGIEMRPIPNMTWDKSMTGLLNGSVMIVPSCVSTPERRNLLELSSPYIIDPIVIVAKKDAPYFSTLNDLAGKKVALSENYYTVDLIKESFPEIEINTYGSIQACLESLISGESDAFVGNLNVITYYRNHYGFRDLKVVGVTPFKESGICFAMNKEWTVFRGIVDKILQEASAHQKHEIRKKWIGINKQDYFYSAFFIWPLVGFISVLAGFIVVYYWNRILKKNLRKKKKTEYELKRLLLEVKKSDEDKKILLQEIHHRVKNNLQIISSMFNLQANSSKNNEATSLALREAMDRVKTIALVHDKIYKAPNISEVDLVNYVETLYQDIQSQYPKEKKVKLSLHSSSINISMNSLVPLALIINELITNSFRHAFDNQPKPEITMAFNWNNESQLLKLDYADNGTWKEGNPSDYFGTTLIDVFTEQIDGEYTLNTLKEGSYYSFEFKNVDVTIT